MTDASRLRLVGGVALLTAIAAGVAFYGTRERAAGPVAPPSVPAPAGPPPRDSAVSSNTSPPAAEGATTPSQATAERIAPRRAAEPPRFDVVRVGARGMAVVAGRAAPGAEVVLYEGGREIGRARTDARGEWVILPGEPIGNGARELSLRARMPGGDELAGPDTVLVVGPAPNGTPVAQGPALSAAPHRAEARRAGESRIAERQPSNARPAEARQAATAAPQREAEVVESPAEPEATPATGARTGPMVLLLPPTASAAPRPLRVPAAGAPPFSLGLDVVDYDDSNSMRFAGTAPPGAQLRVYADNQHLGDAQADSEGRWSLAPSRLPSVGRHMLRVDQLAGTANASPQNMPVSKRVEIAFQRESLPPGLLNDGRVVVQPGNSLWRIAREAYGRGMRYTVIYQANQEQIRNPARIYPGQVFAVPAAGDAAPTR
jgi:nucleoid-associated protein YgaU